MLSATEKAETVREYGGEFGGSDKDTGHSAVQIALLSKRISGLTEHLKIHNKDHHSRRGLLLLVSRRRALLDYLKRENQAQYEGLIARLGIRR